MTGQTDDTQWYIARDGKQHGPLTELEMRTFVAHNYLRATDLIWRPGLPEWQSAPDAFPSVFNPAPTAAHPSALTQSAYAQPAYSQPSLTFQGPQNADDIAAAPAEAARAANTPRRRLAIAAAAVAVIGGGAFALANYADPLMQMVGGGPEKTVEIVTAPVVSGEAPVTPSSDAPPAEPSASDSNPASGGAGETQTAAVEASPSTATDAGPGSGESGAAPQSDSQTATLSPAATEPAAPASVDGTATDVKLRKIPAWNLIKADYPDWYANHVATAEQMAAEKKPDSEIALHFAQGLVALRRQNAEKALSASPEKLRKIATAFLDNLKSLRTVSVSACYGFISKGETSPAVVQLLQSPENATALNAHVGAVFEAISEGSKSPVKHEPAVKADYDILIKELGKLGWKEEDLQAFSNPRLLAKREPDKVCTMVQEWFVAHLSVPDQPARDRLLYETLKPVVSG